MIAFVDSSVILRMVLGQADRLREWATLRAGVAGALVEVECLRTLDRLDVLEELAVSEIASRREAVIRIIEEIEMVAPTRPIPVRAAQPLPVPLGALDAIRLATALLRREKERQEVVMATHDPAPGLAARACGLRATRIRARPACSFRSDDAGRSLPGNTSPAAGSCPARPSARRASAGRAGQMRDVSMRPVDPTAGVVV